jgi:hypothetical protein
MIVAMAEMFSPHSCRSTCRFSVFGAPLPAKNGGTRATLPLNCLLRLRAHNDEIQRSSPYRLSGKSEPNKPLLPSLIPNRHPTNEDHSCQQVW